MHYLDLSTARRVTGSRALPTKKCSGPYRMAETADNAWTVIAERVPQAKKDPNRPARPMYKRTLRKPTFLTTHPVNYLKDWVFDGEMPLAVTAAATPPSWAERLWVARTAGSDCFVWVGAYTVGSTYERRATTAYGFRSDQKLDRAYPHNTVYEGERAVWQLVGVRKRMPAAKPVSEGFCSGGTVTGRISANAPQLIPYKESRRSTVRTFDLEPYDFLGLIGRTADVTITDGQVDFYKSLAAKMLNVPMVSVTPPQRQAVKSFAFGLPYGLADFAGLEKRLVTSVGWESLAARKIPPLGIKPRKLHDEARANALDEAIVRYLNEDLPVPVEWVAEYNELRERLNKG